MSTPTISFFLKQYRGTKLALLMREFYDADGAPRRERIMRGEKGWSPFIGISHTGIGGDCDWDEITLEQAVALMQQWGFNPQMPTEGL